MNAPTIILIILTWWALYTMYRLYVRPTVLFAIKTKIRALRDSMQIAALADADYRNDPAYPVVSKRAEDVESVIHLLNVSNTLFVEADPLTTAEVKTQNLAIEDACGKLRTHEKRLCLYVGAAFAVNGPFLTLISTFLLALFIWSTMVQRWARNFYNRAWTIPEQSVHRHHVTC